MAVNAFCNETMEAMTRLHVSPVDHFVSENWDLDCLQFDTALVKRWHIATTYSIGTKSCYPCFRSEATGGDWAKIDRAKKWWMVKQSN